ncbi:uncharacterized protein J3D65DRAFT_150511 [Phyllosticta citribraziliensis]|uniref:Uncharacterized protein n=1 Tax=Phyllosticta citribraziliensis TaxID=989973 RepID=A0ABR1L4T6_9PEZI
MDGTERLTVCAVFENNLLPSTAGIWLWHACIVTKNAPCRATGLAAEAPVGSILVSCSLLFTSSRPSSFMLFLDSSFCLTWQLQTCSNFFFFFFFRPSLPPCPSKQPIRQIPSQVSLIECDAATCTRRPTPARPLHDHTQKNARWLGNRPSCRPASPICPSRAFWTLPSHAALPSRIRMPARPCVRSPAFWSKTVHIDDVWMPP